jgi:hypothetical protein
MLLRSGTDRPYASSEIGFPLTDSMLHGASTDEYSGAALATRITEMKTETRLQFSAVMKATGRAAAWALVTMMVGLILVILFGSPLAASSPTSYDLPGSSPTPKPGPWGIRPVIVRV